ncbi:MAG: nicotinamide-nucleotide adenylyltransferase [Thermoplasmata archaeon]|nr:MAG: nicotinamide-nucleotide adenylyltransferase [Thermoplasmata archaeon]
MRALVIGRFQPFHLGHMALIKYILRSADDVVVCIGSAQYSHTFDNPFTAGERHLMISRALEAEGIHNYYLVPIEDINVYSLWVAHVEAMVPPFDVIYTNNPLNIRLFKERGYEVKETPIYDKEKYSGRKIRELMINDGPWEERVPYEVARTINEIDGVNRLKQIVKTDEE